MNLVRLLDYKKTKIFLTAAIFAVGFFGFSSFAKAAEFYVSLDGTKTSGASFVDDWSAENCYGNLQAAIAQMSSGDAVVLNDGIYAGVDNTIDSILNAQPPSGTEENYSTIKARNNGMVVFDGQSLRNPIRISERNYIHLDGLVFKNGAVVGLQNLVSFTGSSTSTRAHHIKVTRCGFSEVPDVVSQAGRTNLFYTRYVSYILSEDNYMWGHIGRYAHYMLDSDHIIVRRVVVRIDRGTEEEVGGTFYGNIAAFRSYNSDYVQYQNCLIIDSDQENQYLALPGGYADIPKAFFIDGPDGFATSNNTVVGSLGINDIGLQIYFQGNDNQLNNQLNNSVFAGFKDGIWTREEEGEVLNADHISVIGVSHAGNAHDRIEADIPGALVIKNSVLSSLETALWQIVGAGNDYRSFYNNLANYGGGSTVGAHDITDQNPLAAAILYPPRIEEGSYLKGAGEGGSDIGGEVLYKIGIDGTFYGDSGYDTVTAQSLWPWPNENIIKQHMSLYNLHGVNGARGFAGGVSMDGSAQSLTKYIWEYLGNQIPCEIYDTCGGDAIAPFAPSGLLVL